MRRLLLVLAGFSMLLTGLCLATTSNGALAMNSNTCSNNSYPAPYTGGAGVAKYFYLTDGSTVTITNTGAVIKQGACGNPYREGWINTSDICNIQTAQDLKGRLMPGSSNPYGSATFSGCNIKTSSTVKPAATATATATVNVNTPAVKAVTTSAQPSAATKSLPNTGPGNVLLLSGATSAIGTLGHLYYSRRSRQR